MMTDHLFSTTLAYTKSPKTSKRTTFQDELKAVISARAKGSTTEDQYYYSDDFDNEDDDDIFREFLNSKAKKSGLLKTFQKKPAVNDFQLSDEEDDSVKAKRVSFRKSKRKDGDHIISNDTSDSDKGPNGNQNGSSQSYHCNSSRPVSSETAAFEEQQRDVKHKQEEDDREGTTVLSSDQQQTDRELQDLPPKPRPRQRTTHVSNLTEEESSAGFEASISRPATSSVSLPLSFSDSGGSESTDYCSPENSAAHQSRVSPSGGSQQHESVSRSAEGAPSRGSGNGDNKELHSTCSQDDQVDRINTSYFATNRPSSSCKASSRKGRISRPHTAEPRYLGTLKVLDHRTSLTELQGEDADSLRATVYQDWLKNKQLKSKETLKIKQQEEKLHEEKKKQEKQAKIEDAKVSFEAWKEKKTELLKTKFKQSQEKTKQQQKEMEEKTEKKEIAQQVFQKWKEEQDVKLKEKYKKEKQNENDRKQKKLEEEEERKKDCLSAFSKWNEKKKEIIHEKIKLEHQRQMIKEEEEKYEKDEKDRMALEVYEKWLKRKERQHRKERRQRRIRDIMKDEPPPPWSPPSKTVPFGK